MTRPPLPEASLPISASIARLKTDRRTIVANLLTLFSGSALSQALTALLLLLIARQLGPEAYGQYASSLALVSSLSIVYSLGLNLWLLRSGGQRPVELGQTLGSVLALKGIIGLIWLAALWIVAPLIRTETLNPVLVLYAAMLVLALNLFTTLLTGFKAVLRNSINVFLELTSITAQLVLCLILIQAGVRSAAAYLQVRLAVVGIGLILALLLAHNLLHLQATRRAAWRALLQSPPFAASEFLAWMFMRVDLLIIALFLDQYAAGIYSTAEGILNALFLVPQTVGFVLIPVLSHHFATDQLQAWRTARRTLLLQALVGICLFVVLRLALPLVTLFLGKAFQDTRSILQILSPIILLHSISFGLGAILVATDQQARRSVVQLLAVLFNIGFNLAIIESAGIRGVAMVYVLTEVALIIGYAALVLRRHRTVPSQGQA